MALTFIQYLIEMAPTGQADRNPAWVDPREEEMEQDMPAIRDRVMSIKAEPREDKYSRPRSLRTAQRSARSLRRRWGQGGKRVNSKSYDFDD